MSRLGKALNLRLIKIGSSGTYNDGVLSDGVTPEERAYIASIKDTILVEEDVAKIEELFAYQLTALRKRSASTDGKRLRRLTNIGMAAQTEVYNTKQALISLGIIDDKLTKPQSDALLITSLYDELLSKVCDKLSNMATNGENYQELFTKAKRISLAPTDLTKTNLTKLYKEFGITK